jgi:hypothetical protein
MHSLLCRPHFEKLACRAGQDIPAAVQVRDEPVRFVLSQYSDASNAGVHAVRQGEIDVTEVTRERNRGLALPLRQLAEAGAISTREDEGKRIARQLPHGPPPLLFYRRGGAQVAFPARDLTKQGRQMLDSSAE